VDSSISVAALNIEKQQVIFDQQDVQELDRPGLNLARSQDRNGFEVDINALLTRTKQAAFLRDYLRHRLETESSPPRVVILLSGRVSFPRGNNLEPLLLDRDCRCRVFHLQFGYASQADDVQKLLKPLRPRRFEIATPLDLRKALASIIQELESL